MIRNSSPLVGVVMGSRNDLAYMEPAATLLEEFAVSYEIRVVSAHRTPTDLIAYGESAAERGIEVVVAGAGGAAHLPGMLASTTSLPVVGVPIPATSLAGVDALMSIAQMPAGVPVATVGVGNARNGALLALRILAVSRPELRAALDQHRAREAERSRASCPSRDAVPSGETVVG